MKKLMLVAILGALTMATGVFNNVNVDTTDCQVQAMRCLQECAIDGNSTKVCEDACYTQLKNCKCE